MNSWFEFLQQHSNGNDIHSPNAFPAADSAQPACASAMLHMGLLHVIGPDTGKFLQGQVTCDIRELTQQSLLGAHCTHQGKIRFNFRAVQLSPEHIALIMPTEMVEQAQAALHKYAVFSKVDLHSNHSLLDSALGRVIIELQGNDAAGALQQCQLPAPLESGQSVTIDNNTIINITPSYAPQATRFYCLVTQSVAQTLWLAANPHGSALNTIDSQHADIAQGIGWITTASMDEHVPHSLNLPSIGGVSFKKGCYTGQEVVARMHYKATPKKRLYHLQCDLNDDQNTIPAGGDSLVDSTGKTVGQWLNLVDHQPENTRTYIEGLAVVNNQAIESDDVFCELPQRYKAKQIQLPYAITNPSPNS